MKEKEFHVGPTVPSLLSYLVPTPGFAGTDLEPEDVVGRQVGLTSDVGAA